MRGLHFDSVVEYGGGLHSRVTGGTDNSTDHLVLRQCAAGLHTRDETGAVGQANMAEATITPDGVTRLAPRRRPASM
jgi:hypothetical protein